MFSSIGWTEIAVIVLLGIVIIGPERLPGVIMDVRAAIYAARKAINNAKAELQGEMGGLSEEFETLRGPISQAAEWTRLGPRGAITKALFDGDDSAWDDFDPRKLTEGMGKPHLSAGDEQAHSAAQRGASGHVPNTVSAVNRRIQVSRASSARPSTTPRFTRHRHNRSRARLNSRRHLRQSRRQSRHQLRQMTTQKEPAFLGLMLPKQ